MRQITSTLVRLRLPTYGYPRGSLGVVADVHGSRVLVRWLDPIADAGTHEAPGGQDWIPEEALMGVGMVVLDVPASQPDAASKLWVPGR